MLNYLFCLNFKFSDCLVSFKIKTYVKDRVMGSWRERKMPIEIMSLLFHPLVHCQNVCNSQGCARTKPRARNLIEVSHKDGRAPRTWDTKCCLLDAVTRNSVVSGGGGTWAQALQCGRATIPTPVCFLKQFFSLHLVILSFCSQVALVIYYFSCQKSVSDLQSEINWETK